MTGSGASATAGARGGTARAADADVAGWLGLAAFALLLLSGREQDLLPSTARMALVVAAPVVAVLFAWRRTPWIVIAYCIAGGFLLRWVDIGHVGESDVLRATTEWLQTLLAGQDPYGHYYTTTRPPGSPVPYPPLAHLIHLPGYLIAGFDGVRFTQTALAIVGACVFAVLAWRVAWTPGVVAVALYMGLPNLVNLSVDVGMDTGFGVAMLLAACAVWWLSVRGFTDGTARLAGVALACAVAVKQPAFLLVLPVGAWILVAAGRRALAQAAIGFVVLLLACSLPFLVLWPGTFIAGLVSFAGAHDDYYGWSVWYLARLLGWDLPEYRSAAIASAAATLVAAAVVLLVALVRPVRTFSGALLGGILLILVLFLTAPWSSYSYYGSLAPLVLLVPIVVAWERGWTGRFDEPAVDGPAAAPAA
jgi:hypothetical protein